MKTFANGIPRNELSQLIAVSASVWILTVCFGTFSRAESGDDFAKLKALMGDKQLEIDIAAEAKKKALLQRYATAIAPVKESFQSAGDLEGVVSATREVDSAIQGDLAESDESQPLPEKLQSIREVAEKQFAVIFESRNAEVASLNEKYVVALEALKKALTKAGNLEAAIAVAAEIERVAEKSSNERSRSIRSMDDLPKGIQEGLIAWFAFDEEDLAQAIDSSSSELNGTLEGTSFAKDGKIGGALSFNGSSDRVALADRIPDAERFTIAMWVRSRGTPGKGGLFCDYTLKSGNDLMFSLAGVQKIHIRADKSGHKFQEFVDLPEPLSNDWHHIAWVLGSNDSTLYLDGEKFERVRGEGSNVGFHGGYIGYSYDGGAWSYFDGELDEFMMWDRSLSAEEIQDVVDLAGEN